MTSHPDNSPSEYTVMLRTPVTLPTEGWEAALLSVQYTADTFHNVLEDFVTWFMFTASAAPAGDKVPYVRDAKVRFFEFNASAFTARGESLGDFDDVTLKLLRFAWVCRAQLNAGSTSDAPKEVLVVVSATTKKGFYSSSMELCKQLLSKFNGLFVDTMNAALEAKLEDRMLTVSRTSGEGRVATIGDKNFPAKALGAQRKNLIIPEMENVPSALHVFQWGATQPTLPVAHSLYVYSDLTKSQAVGDIDAPLLGIVPVNKSDGGRVQWTFNPPCYLTVNKTFLDRVQIYIRDDRGRKVEWATTNDNVVCTMRFRRRKLSIGI